MKFIIARASSCSFDCPCSGSKENKYEGRIFWTGEINTLEELIEFKNQFGRIIILDTAYYLPYKDYPHTILIYDEYIE